MCLCKFVLPWANSCQSCLSIYFVCNGVTSKICVTFCLNTVRQCFSCFKKWSMYFLIWSNKGDECVCTCVCILHQYPQRVRVDSLHLHLVLLGLPHITGEHGRKVVWHGWENQSVRGESVSHQSERTDSCNGRTWSALTLLTGQVCTDREKMQNRKGNGSLEKMTHMKTHAFIILQIHHRADINMSHIKRLMTCSWFKRGLTIATSVCKFLKLHRDGFFRHFKPLLQTVERWLEMREGGSLQLDSNQDSLMKNNSWKIIEFGVINWCVRWWQPMW